MNSKKLIYNALVINEGCSFTGGVVIDGERILQVIGPDTDLSKYNEYELINAEGCLLIPGVIDDQVHFREPGLEHKADIYTESAAAVAGGVTSYMEMPNTNPQTITQELLADKFDRASQQSFANYSFYIGATNDNLEELLKTNPKTVCGIKIFMGSSTGNMLVDNPETLEHLFAQSKLLIAVHCEDENTIREQTATYKAQYGENVPISAHPDIRNADACYKSSSMAVGLAKKHGTQLHVLHVSTEKELALFDSSTPLAEKKITAEVCVHHLWFNRKDYEQYGSLIKWNPAIKEESDRKALFDGMLSNSLDVIATDHAPHTLDEKRQSYFKAPSGGPLVQHSLQVMLDFYHQKQITLEKIVEKMCHNPAILFRVKDRGFIREGYFADLVLVDLNKSELVTPESIRYKCKWSPFEGHLFASSIRQTYVNGFCVFDRGKLSEQRSAKALEFDR